MRTSSGGPQQRVLIVEDEALIGLTLAGLLADEGFWVIGPVGSLPGALFALGHASPDAVVLDLTLRDGMCAALLRFMRATLHSSSSRVIRAKTSDYPSCTMCRGSRSRAMQRKSFAR
jgi:DNA-binding response OmpR family regulator